MTITGAVAWAGTLPHCKVLSGVKGGPAILVNGRPYSPLFLAVNNQFGRDEILLSELREAAAAGIALYSINLTLDWDESSDDALDTLDRFSAAHPEGYFYLRVWLGPSRSWMESHAGESITKADGTTIPWPSLASAVWREEASRRLTDRIRQISEGPNADKFMGVCITYLQTGEWFYPDTDEFMDYSNANQAAFRAWLKRKYINDKGLRRAWKDDGVSIGAALIPGPELRDAAALGPFRDPALHRAAMDFHQFQSDHVADTIAHFAGVVKRASRGRLLAGAFYGYTMELNNNGPRALANSGHLSFARLLACPDLDLIHSPYSYLERGLGEPGHFHLPLDSAPLHNKLVIIEEDSQTHLAQPVSPVPNEPGQLGATKSLDETLSLNRRNIANALTHRCGMWYFDLLSDGRWIGKEFWASAPLTRRLFAVTRDDPLFRPEVAFAVDEAGVHLLRATTSPYLLESLSRWRQELARIGAPVGYYLQSDLARLPDSVRVLVLPNAFTLDENQRRAISRVLARGGTVVYSFAPDIWGPNGADPKRVGDSTGMSVAILSAQGPIAVRSEVTEESWKLDAESWELRFAIAESDLLHPIARYIESGMPATAATPRGGGIVVYTAVPRLPVGILRWICANSGVHLYRDTPGMTARFGPYLAIHTDEQGTHRMSLPSKVKGVERIVPASRGQAFAETSGWSDTLPANTTAIYRITP